MVGSKLKLDRRSLLAGSLATVAFPSLAQTKALKLVRHNAASTEGRAMLRIYAQGVRLLQERGASDPLSWDFQWYVHATPQAKDTQLASVFGNAGGSGRALAQEVWSTCQAHLGQPEDYFLPWHRLYVLYFEEVVRTITRTPEFTLPYWDYTDPRSGAIPAEFQAVNRNDPVLGALFRVARNKDDGQQYADVNAGEPINKYFRGAEDFLNLKDMVPTSFSGPAGFNTSLDQNLHGSIHDFVGDATNMGVVPTAAGDPIFWLHHCNIDRIWSGWNASGRSNPGGAWLDKAFVFVDGQGRRVEASISGVANPANLTYVYDDLPRPPTALRMAGGVMPEATSRSAEAGATGSGTVSGTKAALSLGASPSTVVLEPAARSNGLRALAARPQPGAAPRTLLKLNGVQARTSPGTVYKVYVDLPAGADADVAAEHFAGLLTFFNLTATPEHAAHGAAGGRDVAFDITELVARLHVRDRLADRTAVTLVPTGRLKVEAAPVITGGVEIVRP